MVTMNNWEDFWLNEGFAVFIERHVQAQLWNINFAATEAFVGNSSMYSATTNFGLTNTYSSIHPVFKGDNPNNSVSIIPFEKGF